MFVYIFSVSLFDGRAFVHIWFDYGMFLFISAKGSNKFTMSIHHSGKFDYVDDLLAYIGGNVSFCDQVDPDFLSIHEIYLIAEELGTQSVSICWYKHPELPLHLGLTELATDKDIILMTKRVLRYRVINIYLSHSQFAEQLEPLSTEYLVFVSSEEEVKEEGEGEGEDEEAVEEEGEGEGEDEKELEEVEAEDVEVQ